MPNQTVAYFVSVINKSPRLKRKEKEILVNRLKGKTLKKISKKHRVSGERIRQIEKIGLNKFKILIYQPALFSGMEKK
jgi:DNA-directed RNA polymerase sigma subunit (sigma70/sigma32)